MWTIQWWKDVGERAIRTFAASFVAWFTVASANMGIDELNWLRGLALAGIATVISILSSIGTHGVTGNGPSFNSVYKDNPKNIADAVIRGAEEERRGKHDRSGD